MLRKIFVKLCLLLMLATTVGLFSACCAAFTLPVYVNFNDVDKRMGVQSYVEHLRPGEDFTLDFIIPEGYEHSSMTLKVNGEPYDFTVEYSDANIEEEFRYTVDKRIRVSLLQVARGTTFDFDMSGVKRQVFRINIDGNLYSATSTAENFKNNSNLTLVSIKPESTQSPLLAIDDTNIFREYKLENPYVDVEYGEYVVLMYKRQQRNVEIPAVYCNIGDFTPSRIQHSIGEKGYGQYDLAMKGNGLYLYKNDRDSRLFYIGKVQEDITLYRNIPFVVEQKGFVLENDKNKFSLLTNLQDHNSDMLTIDLYQPTTKAYNSNNSDMMQINTAEGLKTLEKVYKYDESGNLKNPEVIYDMYNRYDVCNMYIGEDKNRDSLLTSEEKQSLTDEIYISIKSELFELPEIKEPYGNGYNIYRPVNIKLLQREKQRGGDGIKVITDFVYSSNTTKIIKIDKELIADYIVDRMATVGNSVVDYKTGNAILYFEFDAAYIDNARYYRMLSYSSINYCTYYNGNEEYVVDHDYSYYLYTKTGSNGRNYGLVDYHRDAEDYVFFKTSHLVDTSDSSGTGNALDDSLFIDIQGPKYNGIYTPMISDVTIYKHTALMVSNAKPQDVHVFNGLQGVELNLVKRYPGDQYRVDIRMGLEKQYNLPTNIDFSSTPFNSWVDDSISVTNNIYYTSIDDFESVRFANKDDNLGVKFSESSDLFFVVLSDSPINFDMYVDYDGEKIKVSKTKQLYDITGTKMTVRIGTTVYDVKVKYQDLSIYGISPNYFYVM